MDRSKSRTDLLAAGRKKLQQFRQKKDSKGGSSHGKSSKKSGKLQLPESNADVNTASSTPISIGSSQVTDGNVETDVESNVVITESLESESLANSLDPDNVDLSVDSSLVAITYDIGHQVHGIHETDSELSAQDQGESAQGDGADVSNDVSLRTSDRLGSEGGATHDHTSAPVAILSPLASVTTTVDGSVSDEKEGEKREELLLLSEDIPNTSVMQTRDNQPQVTALGAMQDGDGLNLKRSCLSTDAMIDGQKELPLFEVGKRDQSLSRIALEKTRIDEASREVEQVGKSAELLSSVEDIVSDKIPDSLEVQGDDIAMVGPIWRNPESVTFPVSSHDEMFCQFNQEQISKGVLGGQDVELNQQCISLAFAAEDPARELSPGGDIEVNSARPFEVNSGRPFGDSPIFHANSVNFSRLAEIIRGLNEEEYQFLLKARGVESDVGPLTLSSVLPDHDFSEAFQRLKEELFIATSMMNIFNMQLTEQLGLQLESDNQRHQMIEELSQLDASHTKVIEMNQHLTEELANCQDELRDISGKSLVLQNQFNAAMADIEALSARVVELQISSEMSQKLSLDLSTELADCRGLVSSLQSEKKGMNETVDLLIAEKNKLVEERELHLCESKNLETELADFKSSMEGVKIENANLTGMISSVTEERNKIKAEVDHLLHEIDRLSLELVENKDLVASLEAKISISNGNLALSVDKIKCLENEYEAVALENQRLSSQVVALEEQLSVVMGERMRFEGDLEEATMRLEQLSKENAFLNNTLDKHKAVTEEIEKKNSQPASRPKDLGNQAHVSLNQSKDLEITKDSLYMGQERIEGAPGGSHANIFEHEVSDDSLGYVSLVTGLDEVENVLVKLEKAVSQLHSQSVFPGRSGENVSSPVVSKLIQAFESKVHEDEHESEIIDSSEAQSSSSSFIKFTNEQIGNLRKLLSQWKLDAQSASALFKGERDGRKIGDAKYSYLKDQFEELKLHCSDLEASNIELAVQFETAKQLLGSILEKKCHLEELYEALKQENIHLKAKNNVLYEKLGYCQSKISELHAEMYAVKQSSTDMASIIGSQLKNLQKEVAERAMLLEQGWNNTIAEIVELAGKLNESVGGTLYPTISSGTHDSLDIGHMLAVSVKAASEMIFDLQKKLEVAYSEHEIICMSYNEVNSKCDDLLGRTELAAGVLHKLYSDLSKLVHSNSGFLVVDTIDGQSEALPDLLNYNSYQPIMKQLQEILNEKLEFEFVNKEIKSELMRRETELEELKMKCLGLDSVNKLIEDVAGVLNEDISKMDANKLPLFCLASLVSSLVQKTREAKIQYQMTKEGYGSKEMDLVEMEEKLLYLDTLRLDNENEILVLKESLRQAEEALTVARSELNKKTDELEHSDQRLSSIREKLSIAVAKGKGLVVQRDGLKQSLAETSSELERCMQELQLKDTRLHDVETKLKTYAEAGERVEALESELSYIRNSANALRESFLLKDSMLQRIEEVLEDLDLPEQFHSRGIIEKIDWLASSVAGNSLPLNDWEQKDSAGGGSYSEAGYVTTDFWKDDSQPQPDSRDDNRSKFEELQRDSAGGGSFSEADNVVTDSWKDDSQLQPDSGDDFRKKLEELQSKYYRLAEQNEMLEQSLMERNSLVQRWEELVSRIDMPSHLQSMEMEDRIEWVGRALAEANHHLDSLQLKIEKYNSYCGLLNADLEESQRTVSSLHADLKALTSEREKLSEKMEALIYEYEKLSVQKREAELENENLHNEITSLKDELEQKAVTEEQVFNIDGRIRKLRDLVIDALLESETEDLVSDTADIDSLEALLGKLMKNHASLKSVKPAREVMHHGQQSPEDDAKFHEEKNIDIHEREEAEIYRCKKESEEALNELAHVKEERDRTLEKQISLSGEIEALRRRTEELQELLTQEEQKSASAREKLNVAVRKGKSLVQQRDSLKQTIEEMGVEIEHLKTEIKNRECTLAECKQKLRQLSSYPDRFEALESESLILKNHFEETEQCLREKEYSLKLILNKLGEIEVGVEGHISDPVKKLELVGKLCSDLHNAVASLEQESKKSKRASELLLAELNEVQERNDCFQEELAKVAAELLDLRRERDLADTAKLEALAHLENLSALHEEGKKRHFSEVMKLKSIINQVCESFGEVQNLLANVFFMDMEYFRNLEAGLQSCLIGNSATNVVKSSVSKEDDDILCMSSDIKKNSISENSPSDFDKIDNYDDDTIVEVFRLLGNQLQEFMADVDSFMKRIIKHKSLAQEHAKTLSQQMADIQKEMTFRRESCETMKKEVRERDCQLNASRGNIAYIYEACVNSIVVLETGKTELVRNEVEFSDLGIGLKTSFDDGISEECVKTMADRLMLAAKGFASMKTEFLDANQQEMRATITNLQRELQEKDVQRDRICSELVKQIKDAEAAVNSYSQDLQSSRIQEDSLKKQVELIEAERKILEQRVNELQDREAAIIELQEKMRSQTDLLGSKDQEIEALMHALDEEEMQMEELTKKLAELEKVVRQKNQEIDNLESSRGKVMKKLSVTVSKFDELHHLSASLISEVEKLQSQLQERDAEISFLRQEVTRCTNDVLLASHMSNQRNSDEIFEFLMWVDTIVSQDGMRDIHPDSNSNNQVHEYKEVLHRKLMSLLSELENLKAIAESKDAILQVERGKVEELNRKAKTLETSLHKKELQLNLLEGVEETGKGAGPSSEIIEVEPVMNEWTTTGAFVTPQVRSLRKGTSDHVAIAVDVGGSTSRIEDEDDDKVHGFKSLTSSKIVPRFTRPLTDLIDGLWVSCDRTLMRQPVLRLGIIVYWAIMHALLAFFVV